MSLSGRYYIRKDGRTFCIEPIHERNEKNTDSCFQNGGISGDEIKRHGIAQGGSIREEDSILTKENGFKNIVTLPPGHSPNGYIEELLKQNKR